MRFTTRERAAYVTGETKRDELAKGGAKSQSSHFQNVASPNRGAWSVSTTIRLDFSPSGCSSLFMPGQWDESTSVSTLVICTAQKAWRGLRPLRASPRLLTTAPGQPQWPCEEAGGGKKKKGGARHIWRNRPDLGTRSHRSTLGSSNAASEQNLGISTFQGAYLKKVKGCLSIRLWRCSRYDFATRPSAGHLPILQHGFSP